MEQKIGYACELPVAVVTGAAKGIGAGIAESFCEAGYRVAMISRGTDIYEQTLSMKKQGYHASAYVCDITDRESVQGVINDVVKEIGEVKVLVNSAGVSGVRPFEDMDDEMLDRQINTNLKGTIYVTQAVIPYMKKAMCGRIINMSSVTGAFVSDEGYSSYAMTKAGLVGLTKALAVEYAGYGITCNAICPGFVQTPAVVHSASVTNPDHPESVLEEIASGVPLGRLGSPKEIGALAVFLASEAAGYITGTTTVIDGGSMLPETPVKRFNFYNSSE